jgi:hypothetical protein
MTSWLIMRMQSKDNHAPGSPWLRPLVHGPAGQDEGGGRGREEWEAVTLARPVIRSIRPRCAAGLLGTSIPSTWAAFGLMANEYLVGRGTGSHAVAS